MTPKVRFKGFDDAWEQRKVLNEVNSIDTGKSKFEAKESGEFEILGSTGVIGYDDSYDYEGDFLLTARVGANAGTLYRHSGKVKITDNTVFLQGNHIDFIFYLLDKFDLKKMSFGSGQPLIKASEVKSLELQMPTSNEEKEKIAEYFLNLDNLITLHQRQCEALKKQKQFFLQNMFPKEGESEPRIRFNGFTEPWEQRKFKEIAIVRRGLTYSPKDVSSQGVRVLRSSNIEGEFFLLHNDDVFVNSEVVKIEYVKRGDILITAANGSPKLVGKHAIIDSTSSDLPMVHGGFMLVASSNFSDFLNASMGSFWYSSFLKRNVTGGNGAIGNLSKADLDEVTILLPSDNEKIKIGAFFKNLDNLITLHQRQYEQLVSLKKYLLSKMFI